MRRFVRLFVCLNFLLIRPYVCLSVKVSALSNSTEKLIRNTIKSFLYLCKRFLS